ncbi:isochorismatase family protein [Pseudonocardia ailaonensis]|uniref:Isochorismatase family protein n=1 Tax=Pseudonocardia ailaonensis TaxID=367279 RepID=A0ABN2NJF3_9PSEU
MSLTRIDPVSALVLIDLQKDLVPGRSGPAGLTVVERAADLAAAFRRRGLPVVLVTVAGGPFGRTDRRRPERDTIRPAGQPEVVDELDAQPSDHRVTKRRRSAFHDTGLDTLLRDLGVTQVVLAGVSTSSGVESTARSAFDHGYHVVLATDAMTDTDPDAHRHSVDRVFPKIAETATTAEIVGAVEGAR